MFLRCAPAQYRYERDGLAIPARFRSKIERGAVLEHAGLESCLLCLSAGDLREQKARELDAAILDPRQRRVGRRPFLWRVRS